jgi:hypothetical protein
MFGDILRKIKEKEKNRGREGFGSLRKEAALGSSGAGDSSDISNPAANLMGPLMGDEPFKNSDPTGLESAGIPGIETVTGDMIGKEPEQAFGIGMGFEDKEAEVASPFSKPPSTNDRQAANEALDIFKSWKEKKEGPMNNINNPLSTEAGATPVEEEDRKKKGLMGRGRNPFFNSRI